MNEEQLYSLEQLEAMSAGDEAFINKMVEMFIHMTPEAVDRMVTSLANDDLEDVGAAAHKIKPSIDMMGITSLRQKIRDLEQWGKNRTNVDQIPDLLDDVIHTLNDVIQQLKAR
ncbi:MAG: Hpt domain-containing protein [Flavobacteriales bacterium]|nr:Hpt domain-containing protein [Flavobacteriales bacterium]